MIGTLNITEMTERIFFTADTHFLHPKIVDICGRPITREDHDEWLINIWNSTVEKKDTIYVLGDFSMGNRKRSEAILDKLHGNKILILGNHDESIKNSTRWSSVTQIKDLNPKVVDEEGNQKNIHLVLCHYPLTSWNRKVHGSMHLYGHVHGRFQNNGMSFDVGLDANDYKILTLEEVLDKFTKRMLDVLP